MIPERKNPYEDLIQQFLQNTQQLAGATETRFQGQREERLIGEERDFRVQREELGWQREDQIADRNRENVLTDQAVAYRQTKIDQLISAMSTMDPESEEFQMGNRYLAALRAGSGLTGEAARQQVTNGFFTLDDGTEFNMHEVIGRYLALSDEYRRDTAFEDLHRQTAYNFVSNTTLDPERRRQYINDFILPSDMFTEGMKDSLLQAAGFSDPDTRAQILLNREVTETQIMATKASIAATEASTALSIFQLEQGKRAADLTYEMLNQEVRAATLAGNITEMEAFTRFGGIPDGDAAIRLASRLGYDSVEELQEAGAIRWKRFQDREAIELRQLQQAVQIGDQQIDMNRVAVLAAELQYNRDLAYSAIRDRTEMAELAFAASRNGDVGTIQVLQSLYESGSYDEELGGLPFDTLMEDALLFLGDEKGALEHDRQMRDLALANDTLIFGANSRTFYETAGATFAREDFTPGEDGRMPVEDEIDAYIANMSGREIAALGGTDDADGRAAVRAQLMREAWRAKFDLTRSDASAAVEALGKAVPPPTMDSNGNPVNNAERVTWESVFIQKAVEAGIDEDVAQVIATGLLEGDRQEFYLAMLDAEEVQARTRLLLAQAANFEIENDALTAEGEDLGDGWVQLDEKTYDDLLAGLNAVGSSLDTRYETSGCAVGATDTAGTVHVRDDDLCAGIEQEQQRNRDSIQSLMAARLSGNPIHIDSLYGNITASDIDFQMASGWEAIRGFGVTANVADLQVLAESGSPDAMGILMTAAAGGFRDVDDLNEVIAVATAELLGAREQQQRELRSISNVDIMSDEWRSLSTDARRERLMDVTEWNELVDRVMAGTEVGDERGTFESFIRGTEAERLARQFGFTSRGVLLGPWAGQFEGPGTADIDGFQKALADSVRQRRQEGLRAGWSQPGQGAQQGPMTEENAPPRPANVGSGNQAVPTPSITSAPLGTGEVNTRAREVGLITPEGVAGQPLLDALIQQESGGKHRRDDGALTMSGAGAMGITQVMPATGWRPGHGVRPLYELSPEDNARMTGLYSDYQAANRAGNAAKDAGRDEQAQSEWTRAREIHAAMEALVLPYAEQASEAEFRRFGADYLNAMLVAFNGDVAKALAAYNAGEGTVRNAVRGDPVNWLSLMKPETQGYVPNILSSAMRTTTASVR